MAAIPPNMSNAWPLSASIVDRAGHAPTSQYLGHACPTLLTGQGDGGLQGCVAHVATRFHEVVNYQPAGRYWPFQIYETALFALVALALGALSVWWVRRRLV